jgi:hypothetical protein
VRLFVFSDGKLGIAKEFVDMVKLLFQDAIATFQIKRGVSQGCPLVPYLLLIMYEVLNIMIKQATTRGEMHGIKIPSGQKE